MIDNFDEFAEILFNEAKYLLEQAKSHVNTEQIERCYLHSSLLLGMSALEAYVNGISMELTATDFGLDLMEKAFILEKKTELEKGTFQVKDQLKMQRLIDRIEFIYCRFSGKLISESDEWDQGVKNTIKLRNNLVHPKSEFNITYHQVELALTSILHTINELYLAVYHTNVPILNYGLQATI